MGEIIGLFFLVAWWVGLWWLGTRKVVKRMWNRLPGRNFVVYALIAVAIISIIHTLMTEQETMANLP